MPIPARSTRGAHHLSGVVDPVRSTLLESCVEIGHDPLLPEKGVLGTVAHIGSIAHHLTSIIDIGGEAAVIFSPVADLAQDALLPHKGVPGSILGLHEASHHLSRSIDPRRENATGT